MSDLKDTIFIVFLTLTMGLMSVKVEYTNFTLIPVVLVWFWSGQYKNLSKTFKESKIYFLITFFFLLVFLSVIVYHNQENLKQMEKRLVFVFFPLIISSTNFLDKKRIIFLIKVFGYAITLICVFALTKILLVFIEYNYLPNLGEGPWVEEYILMHRPYFGMYSSFTIVCFIYFLENKLSSKFIAIFIIVTNILVIFFITAKLAIIFLGLYLMLKAIILIGKERLFKQGVLLILLFLIPLLFVYKYNTEFFLDRINSPIRSQDRPKTWSSAVDVMKSDDFNILLGFLSEPEFQKHLDARLTKKNYTIYNTHNQYLGYLGAYGLFGLFIFTFVLIKLLLYSIKNQEKLFTLFLLLICFQCLTENIFYRQWGIFFIAIFTSLFIRLISENKKIILNEKSSNINTSL